MTYSGSLRTRRLHKPTSHSFGARQAWIVAAVAGGVFVLKYFDTFIVQPHERAIESTESTIAQLLGNPFDMSAPVVSCEASLWNPSEPIMCIADVDVLSLQTTGNPFGHRTHADGVQFDEGEVHHDRDVIVLVNNPRPGTEDHERRHAEQGDIQTTTMADVIISGTYREADARVEEIILAYEDFLRTGRIERWQDMAQNEFEMVAVFDELLRTEDGQQSLANLRVGRDPAPEIMRATAMAYFFSRTAQHYLRHNYMPALGQPADLGEWVIDGARSRRRTPEEIDAWFVARQDFRTELEGAGVTIASSQIGAAMPRGGIDYLNSGGNNLVNRVLYEYLLEADYTGATARLVTSTPEHCYSDERSPVIMLWGGRAPCEAFVSYQGIALAAAGIDGTLWAEARRNLGSRPLQPFQPTPPTPAPVMTNGLRGSTPLVD